MMVDLADNPMVVRPSRSLTPAGLKLGLEVIRMSLAQFLAHLSAQGIAVVDHDPAELAQGLAAFDPEQ